MGNLPRDTQVHEFPLSPSFFYGQSVAIFLWNESPLLGLLKRVTCYCCGLSPEKFVVVSDLQFFSLPEFLSLDLEQEVYLHTAERPVGLGLDGAEMVNGVGQSKVCPARTFKQGIEKDVGLVKNGQSEKQVSSGFESFIVDKKAWEEARQELYGFFTQVKKEMGQQEFEEKKGEIVEKANGKYMEKIKALAKYRGDLKSHGVVE
nr:uncharacterized protein LOC109159462 [Ipomoea batatas]